MQYVNRETGKRIDLRTLTEEERQFYLEAKRRFQENTDWIEFDNFVFGLDSPIYRGKKSYADVRRNPLFVALLDMSLQLGVQQGVVVRQKRPALHEKETSVSR